MDVSFQPKSQMPDEGKKGPSLSDIFAAIKALYVGDGKNVVVILLTISILIISLAVGGMVVLNTRLQNEVTQKKQALDTEDNKLKGFPATQIRETSNRIKIVNQVVKNQSFITSFLKSLEYSVEDNVIFGKTTLSAVNIAGVETFVVSIDATALTYNDVVNQFLTMQKREPYNTLFSDIKMRNLAVDKQGIISFKISGNAKVKEIYPETDFDILFNKDATTANASTSNTVTEQVTSTTTP